MPKMAALTLVAHGEPARAALWQHLGELQAGDPLSPVTVAPPSTYAGLSLRRAAARRESGAAANGLVGVRFMPLGRVAELLGAPFLAQPDRRPLTPPVRAGAVRAALAGAAAPLGAAADHPITRRALTATFRELATASESTLERLAAASARAAAVIACFRRYRDLTAAYYDDEDQLRAAASLVGHNDAAMRDLGTVVLFCPRALSPAAVDFVTALACVDRVRAILAVAGEERADRAALAMARSLEAALGGVGGHTTPAARIGAERVVSCPDADEEVRTVARDLLTALEAGTGLHRIAIGYAQREPYALLLHELLPAGGIPVHGPSPHRLADTVAARTLLALLLLPYRDFRRDDVMALLAGAPVREQPRHGAARPGLARLVPGPRWERISCEANVVAGLSEWHDRLQHHAAVSRERQRQRAEEAGTLFAGDGIDGDADHAERLACFVAELARACVPPPDAAWRDLAAWADGLVDRYLAPDASWPSAEVEAFDALRARLCAMATLDDLGVAPSPRAFLDTLVDDFDAPVGPVGRFGDGVFVAPVGLLAGMDYDVVYILGLSEGTFPRAVRDDPLLPDAERDPAGLALRAHATDAEHAAGWAALAAGRHRVLTFPRADVRTRRSIRPARLVLDVASERVARPVRAGELERLAPTDWLRVVPSAAAGMIDATTPMSVQEHDVVSLLRWRRAGRPVTRHPLARAEPTLANGLRAARARRRRRVDAWDGAVGALPGLGPRAGQVLSPTSLEQWAHCPFRYFLAKVLRLEALERPEAREDLSPLDRGTLVHEALCRFFDRHRGRAPAAAWTADERAELAAIGDSLCDELEATGLTGRPALWRLQRTRLQRELQRTLDVDERVRGERQLSPAHLELGFGLSSTELPALSLELAGRAPVQFRGRVDRVDVGRDGHIEVFDYKSRRARDDDALMQEEDPVAAGTRLQLALYALALRSAYPDSDVRASYWLTRADADEALWGFWLDETVKARVDDVLATIVGAVDAGQFPAFPGREGYFGPDNCGWCDFDRLCPKDRVRRYELRADDPAYDAFAELHGLVDGQPEADEAEAEGQSEVGVDP